MLWKKGITSLSNDKILDRSEVKAFADDKIKVLKNDDFFFVFDRDENIEGKGENAGYQHFSFFYNVFKRLPFQGRHCVVKS